LYPYSLVPALPEKTIKLTDEHLSKRLKLFNRFLNAICKNEVLKTCKLVVDFLKIEDKKIWLAEK
jgi:hypothetical protein